MHLLARLLYCLSGYTLISFEKTRDFEAADGEDAS